MADPFIGEIRLFGGNFAPLGWMACQGQFLPIQQFENLFSLIGTTYGGDGQVTFALPDLRGRVPIHRGNTILVGEVGGSKEVTITVNQLPPHTHEVRASTQPASTGVPNGNVVADTTLGATPIYGPSPAAVSMSPATVEPAGQSMPHENRMPYLGMNYIICIEGIYPSQN
jgi:microcystin-dependent protein